MTTDPLKTQMWADALELCSDFEPRVTGYNELQAEKGGPLTASVGLVWSGHSHDTQRMYEVREAFIALQDRPCCEHGNAWQNSDGEATTLEYVPFYRLCACCSTVIKRDDETGGDPRCHICSKDELILDDISDEAIHVMLSKNGWEPISREEALSLMNANRLVIGNCDSAIGGARRMGEGLWSNPALAMREHEDLLGWTQEQAQRDVARDGKVYEGTQRSIDRHQEQAAAGPAYVMGLSGALSDIAQDRWEALGVDY